VLPWYSSHLDPVAARTACQNAGKRLCQLDEWIYACRGAENTDYAYGDDYDPAICNSIDTYCYCDPGTACEDRDPCPFPHCREVCGAYFTDEPTGFFPDCVNSWGVYDINGNVWELTETDEDDQLHFRGGAFNCGDSERLHRCDHDGTWGPSAQGFRCCSDGQRLERGGGG
jgi:formylglycine-generating enzyme required for sulfatase activity